MRHTQNPGKKLGTENLQTMHLLLIAGGIFFGATTAPQPEPDLYNHTLRGDRILAREVVCRNRWGTPMLPDGKAGYSLIAPINQQFIDFSLVQPPKSPMEAFRPVASATVVTAPTP